MVNQKNILKKADEKNILKRVDYLYENCIKCIDGIYTHRNYKSSGMVMRGNTHNKDWLFQIERNYKDIFIKTIIKESPNGLTLFSKINETEYHFVNKHTGKIRVVAAGDEETLVRVAILLTLKVSHSKARRKFIKKLIREELDRINLSILTGKKGKELYKQQLNKKGVNLC